MARFFTKTEIVKRSVDLMEIANKLNDDDVACILCGNVRTTGETDRHSRRCYCDYDDRNDY